nr:guanylate kinase [Clostridium minihomine]
MTKGLMVVFSGPSGVGKDTVLRALLAQEDSVKLSVSATTRSPRPGEQDGRDYYYVTREQFQTMIENGEVLEHAEYCGNYYGTPLGPIQEWQGKGYDVILEIEVQGGAQIKEKNPDCVSVFLLPPSLEVLESRLRDRASDSEDVIEKRLTAACDEIQQARNYDYLIVNDTVEHAVEQIRAILCAEKLRFHRADSNIERMLNYAKTIS